MKHPIVALPIAVLLATAGCGRGSDAAMPSTVEVSWQIGGSTCGASGVSTVRVSLVAQQGVFTSETAACQLGTLILRDVPGGLYTVQVDGYRAGSDVPNFTGVVQGIDVRPGAVTIVPRVELAETPGGIDVTWKFEGGELCGFAGVDTVIVNIWDGHANRVFEQSFPCDPQLALAEAERKQPTRALYDTAKGIVIDRLYAGQYTLRAFALLAGVDLHPKYWAEATPVVTYSKLTPVALTLSPCQVVQPDGSTTFISLCM